MVHRCGTHPTPHALELLHHRSHRDLKVRKSATQHNAEQYLEGDIVLQVHHVSSGEGGTFSCMHVLVHDILHDSCTILHRYTKAPHTPSLWVAEISVQISILHNALSSDELKSF